MKVYLLMVLAVMSTLQVSAQTTTRQDGILYRLYDSGEGAPYAEIFGYALEENASVTIPDSIVKNETAYPVTSIASYAFNRCKELVGVTLGSNIKSISEGAFNECGNLQSVEMTDSIRSIGGYAFNRCAKLERIDFSQNLDYILSSAFSFSGLTEVIFPSSLQIIGQDAFWNCHNLKTVTIQSEVRIDREAFKECESISEIYYKSPVLRRADKNIFDNDIYKTATLYVSQDGMQSAYDTEPWLYFVHIKDYDSSAIEDIRLDNTDANDTDLEIYDSNGFRYSGELDLLVPGFYIIRKGSSVKKIIVK